MANICFFKIVISSNSSFLVNNMDLYDVSNIIESVNFKKRGINYD